MKIPVGRNVSQKAPRETKESFREKIDRQAIERAENEGMTINPEESTALRHAPEIDS